MGKRARRIVGAALGAAVGFVLAPVIGVAAAVGIVGGALIGAAASDTLAAIISPNAFDTPSNITDQAAISQNEGITVNTQGTAINLPIVYGRRKLGGTRVFISSSGEKNANLYLALAVCEGPIAGFEKIYIDDTLVYDGLTADSGIYTLSTTKYKGLVTIQAWHGNAGQPSGSLLGELSGSWTANHRLQGIAYLAVKLVYPKITDQASADANPWSNGIPKITAQVRGRTIANAATFGTSVSRATAYDAETVAFNDNPINVLLDYLRNPLYGKGLSNDEINFNSFYQATQKWDKNASGTILDEVYRHKFNGIIFTDRTILDNVKTILSGMRSSLVYTQGRFTLQVEDNGSTDSVYFTSSTPVKVLNHDNIIGGMNIESESTQTKYNRVIVTYMGGDANLSQPTFEPIELQYPPVGSTLESQYLTEDNGRVNEYRQTLEHITSTITANNIAQIILLKSRTRGKTIAFTADSSAAVLDVNDIITVQYGYSTTNYPGSSFTSTTPSGLQIDGTFRITNILVNDDYTFNITAAEHDDNVYGQAPQIVNSIQQITRAPAGSGIVADIYTPSSSQIPLPVVTVLGHYTSTVNGFYYAATQFSMTAIIDGTIKETDIYLKDNINNNFIFLRKDLHTVEEYVNGVPKTKFSVEGLRFNTNYTLKVQHRNYVGSVSDPVEIPFTTTAGQNSQYAPYQSIITFGN